MTLFSTPTASNPNNRRGPFQTIKFMKMADGYNNARALRVAEIMADFRNLQYYIAQIQANPAPEDYYLEGYSLLRACVAEAQAILASPYAYGVAEHPQGDPETEKSQLQAVIIDASVRRFQCQRCYLRAVAGLRWMHGRNTILGGQRPHAGNAAQLQAIDIALRTEVAAVTDEQVEYSLRAQDTAQGKWLDEDPSLSLIRQRIRRAT
ncbi:hypothetical protein E2P81_ATG01329 [Venturia nashicola]|uniref:Uncharacterized protein n=1 Tax=Venturia nashicola TaxID=86259 RepID=A0A4Z1PLH4_9PEZI|nr:hypothetical protein E6O75_ATG01359 [Venturia nashicola]TLD38786.1 hypothetical protein E2P81_ATG01329 [Venturia nashicola]